jgi:hypothetical protein
VTVIGTTVVQGFNPAELTKALAAAG